MITWKADRYILYIIRYTSVNSLIGYVRRLCVRGTPQFSNLIWVWQLGGGQWQGHRRAAPPLAPPIEIFIKQVVTCKIHT